MPLALKIIKISEILCYLPDKVTILHNFARKMSEFYVIIARKKYLFTNFFGARAPDSYAYVDKQYKRHYAAKKM